MFTCNICLGEKGVQSSSTLFSIKSPKDKSQASMPKYRILPLLNALKPTMLRWDIFCNSSASVFSRSVYTLFGLTRLFNILRAHGDRISPALGDLTNCRTDTPKTQNEVYSILGKSIINY